MKIITSHSFKYTLRDVHKNTENRRFCFVIGAGASRKSGIPTGGELAQDWFKEIKERMSDVEFTEWIKSENIDEKYLAASYGKIYRKRFENDKTSGYEFLVQAMKTAKPSFGHIVLAQILSRTSGHCVITTNFDSLVETSVYQFTDKTPLVCGHESLSGYARPSKTHPLIIKIHRDLLLEPKSDSGDISELDPGWKEPLDHIFSTHIPVIVGYGGNDGSLMKYFEEMNKPSNFFWCGLDENSTSDRIKQLVEKHDGSFIKIEGFDKLMHELLWVFDEIKPIKEELKLIADERIQIASKQLDEITDKKSANSPQTVAAPETKEQEISALEYAILADNEPDYEKREKIYLKAIEKYPTTSWLLMQLAYFFHVIKKDYNKAEEFYLKALSADPNDAINNGNFAYFLEEIKKDYNKAEEFYLRALSADPDHVNNNGNYATFLNVVKKEYDKAEKFYLIALSSDPNHAIHNGNYAIFLKDIKKDYNKAEEFYLRALSVDPNNANLNGNYANFLNNIKKENVKAEEYYLRALSADLNNANSNGNYANFLKNIKKENVKAEEYYLRALSADPNNANINGNYAQILLEKGKLKEAKIYIDTAYKNRSNENDLLIELWFYRYAHYPEYLKEAETEIENLLKNGFRSVGWDFSGNIEQAIKNGHSNPEKLKEFAKRITSE